MAIEDYNKHTPKIDPSSFIHASAIVIGDVTIGAHCSIWPLVTIRGDVNTIHIGNETNIQDNSVLHVTADSRFDPGGFPLTIGSRVTIGHQVILHACSLDDGCLIGMGSIVMDGVSIGAKAFIGAGSLVPPNKKIEGGYLWLGSPVKKIRKLNDDELESLEYSADHYMALKDSYMK